MAPRTKSLCQGLIALLCLLSAIWCYSSERIKDQYRFNDFSAEGDPSYDSQTSPRKYEQEMNMAGGIRKYVTGLRQTQTDLLWLVMTNDNTSWGDSLQGVHISRSIDDVHEIIHSQYDPLKVSLGLLTSSRTEYELYKLHPLNENYGRVTIYLHPGYHTGQAIDRKDRHDSSVQYQRRSMMAKLRNFLMLKTLHDEKHIVWLDADVWYLDPGIINRMIQHVTKDEDSLGESKGLIMTSIAGRGRVKGPENGILQERNYEMASLLNKVRAIYQIFSKAQNRMSLFPLMPLWERDGGKMAGMVLSPKVSVTVHEA
ncbi:hypothetical protein C1H76_3486 [Elsinoe australis]|uniref:Uncharacterized protein n=1 Tax=Elsinoe australis TaxID=40998 RepID=A0A4U7B579_9PEZI|nr:hypothetical protein C1H76_3486 [Elsinoe australis]